MKIQAANPDDIAWMIERIYTRKISKIKNNTSPAQAGKFRMRRDALRALYAVAPDEKIRLSESRILEPWLELPEYGLTATLPRYKDEENWGILSVDQVYQWNTLSDEKIEYGLDAVKGPKEETVDIKLGCNRIKAIFEKYDDELKSGVLIDKPALRRLSGGGDFRNVYRLPEFVDLLGRHENTKEIRVIDPGDGDAIWGFLPQKAMNSWRLLQPDNPIIASVLEELQVIRGD